MGAMTFIEYGYGDDPGEVFDQLVNQARHEHGHGGYTGTIAEKTSFRVVKLPEGQDPEKFANAMSMKDFRDKWGPAGAFECPVDEQFACPECSAWIDPVDGRIPEHISRYGSYRTDDRGREIPGSRSKCRMSGQKVRKWCFFGWASS